MKNKLKTLLALLLIAVIALSAVACITESGSTGGFSNNTSENEETKKEYDIYPGCIVQRIPNTPHYTTLAPNSKWKEFYICSNLHFLC